MPDNNDAPELEQALEALKELVPDAPAPEEAPEGAAEAAADAANEANEARNAEDAKRDPLAELLDAAKAKADEYLNLAQRVQADFDNFRKRNERVRADAYEDGRRAVATAFLPVLDSLERALAAAGEDSPLKTGVDLTLRQMRSAYDKLGVTPIDRAGERFDPKLEEAVLPGTAEEGEPGTVCQVLQKGYRMGDNVLRPAMVRVVPE